MNETLEIPPRPPWLKRKPTKTTEAAERAAHKFVVDPAQVLALMPEALHLLRQNVETIERAKGRARQLTGLDARIIASRENKYRDHSTHPRFDETSRELAAEFPELGFDPDGHDTPQRVWEFIREGKQPIPVRHSDIVAETAAQWCEQIETEDFPDDADGFDPSEWESPAYVAGTHHPVCDVQPKEEPCQSQSNVPIAASQPMDRLDRPTDGNWKTVAQSATSVALPTRNASLICSSVIIAPKGIDHVDENPSRHVFLQTPWSRSARRVNRRRETPRPVAGGRTLPPVRSERIASDLVRPHRPGRDPGRREAAGRANPRLNRVTRLQPVYVAGSGIPASIRVRDGPRLIRHPLSVV